MVFGEQTEGGQAVLLVVATLLGGAASWLVGVWRTSRAERRKNDLEDDARETLRLESLLSRIDKERVELREDARKLDQQMMVMEGEMRKLVIRAGIMEGWLRYYEAILDQSKIQYQKFVIPPPGEGSDVHASLPEGNQ